MQTKVFKRKLKESKPVLAICYDFDKTLSPDDMQAQGFIQSVGYDVKEFWKESNELASKNDMDQNLAYMYTMIDKARNNMVFSKEMLYNYGKKVELFKGVEKWFDRINEYGEQNGVIIEHYIISSGLKEMIEGTAIANKFEKIYASSFYFDEENIAKWPAQVVNFTNKTQFLFRIEKGVLDINDADVNEYFNPSDIRVPFRNLVYIGDSDTDIPCMKLVNMNGGHSIGVYNPETNDKTKVHRMLRENRVKYFAAADYRKNSEIDKLLKSIIERTAKNEALESVFNKCKQETLLACDSDFKTTSINKLSSSKNFVSTHMVIKDLKKITDYTSEERERLFDIALNNMQVKYILRDVDVKSFYKALLKQETVLSENQIKVKEILNSKD